MSQDAAITHPSGQGSSFERALDRVLQGFLWAGVVILLAMIIMTTIHGIGRYLFKLPIPGAIELSCYMLVSFVFLMSGYTMVQRRFITVEFVVDRFGKRGQAITDLVCFLICLAFEILAFTQSWIQGVFLFGSGQVSSILSIPQWPFLFIVGLGWLVLALATVLNIIYFLRRAVTR